MNIEQRDLVYGSKVLTVTINPESGSAQFRFGTRKPGWLHRRIEGETTAIFRLGEELLKERAASLHAPIRLTFDTANSNLKLWVMAHKEDLKLDSIDPEDPEAYRLTVIKTYKPSE